MKKAQKHKTQNQAKKQAKKTNKKKQKRLGDKKHGKRHPIDSILIEDFFMYSLKKIPCFYIYKGKSTETLSWNRHCLKYFFLFFFYLFFFGKRLIICWFLCSYLMINDHSCCCKCPRNGNESRCPAVSLHWHTEELKIDIAWVPLVLLA